MPSAVNSVPLRHYRMSAPDRRVRAGWLKGHPSDLGDVGWKALFHTFAESFNLKAISGGDVAEVEIMVGVFNEAYSLDPDVGDWDTGKVITMRNLFSRTSANPDVSKWDTSEVESMSEMFKRATSAQPDMSNWSFAKIEYMSGMFAGLTLPSANYTSLLKRLQATATSNKVTLDAGKSDTSDSDAIAARTALTGRGWTIHDNNNVAASEWEIVMDMIIKESAEGVFDVTVKIEDQWGNKPNGTVSVSVALDELDRLNGTTVINTTNGVAEFTGLSPKMPADFSFPSPIKAMGKLEVGATLPDGKRLHGDAGVILTFK